jgi:hypothetical protein
MEVVDAAVRGASAGAGQVLRGVLRTVDAVRHAGKPLHPRGAVTRGVLERHGSRHPCGVPWLDEPGRHDAVARWSRSVGLPGPLPDVLGLAVRVVLDDGQPADVLFSTTGTGPLSRFALLPRRSSAQPMTTLLPYRTTAGPVLLAAEASDARTVDLAWARSTGAWQPFATLLLDDAPDQADDRAISFDPVLHPLPGLGTYDWVRRLREPSYRSARAARDADLDASLGSDGDGDAGKGLSS